ncbi:MAG: bifunctional (p)ppGpp synthetase/guanosine-3',5'-bis(diphosphate) 3'-pyrophosphohydrolase [Ruminococcaceae bacterium]|nr:bifunctional (p)ppGpp synthetase/guanosine-3',5'-bis(diphosphate) 3'-pyrophosphohydrolase [Oscillospiraceae bacterium]
MDQMYAKLIETIQGYNPGMDFDTLQKAYDLAKSAHADQVRNTGEPYIIHPLSVAQILAELELDCESLVGALLHDVVEDTDYTIADVAREFGDDVSIIVNGVTKLSKIQYTTQEEQQIENLRKMFLAMAKDIRVILIKLADRLHNMRTLKFMSEDKQREKARETLEVYAALAHRLGMSKIKWELEDLSLRYLDPVAYREISESISQKRKEREQYIADIIETFRQKLNELGIRAQLNGRAKHFYSIFRKMYTQNKNIDEIYDLFAVRAIVDSVKDCYAVLGMVHELYYPIPGRFKDYIAMPKPNMYQSLHTTVMGPSGIPFEVQIRTQEMHKVAEFGIAAHWKYKEGVSGTSDMDEKLAWIGKILEIQNETVDSDDFMRTLKIDLFADEVFVFTPKGDVINLPAGSTSIDFAFAIHSAVGCRMAGVRVNGKIATLDYILQNGDIVEVLTSSAVHGPSRDWLKICKTSQARTKINQWFKKERREENILRGKDMIDKEMKRLGFTHSQLFKPEWTEVILKKYGMHTQDDIYAAVGYGALTVNKVLSRLKEEYRLAHKNELQAMPIATQKLKRKSSNGIIVEGIDNCLVRLSRCCNPVPGDPVIGYITRGRGVSVHRTDCPNIQAEQQIKNGSGRLIQVHWEDKQADSAFLTDLQIAAYDRQGLLAEITGVLFDMKILINAVHTKTTKEQIAIINITLEISSKEQLDMVAKKLSGLGGVFEVTRHNV